MPVNSVLNDRIANELETILTQNANIFDDGIGKVKGITAKLTLQENARPRFMKVKNVPYSLKPKIEKKGWIA